MKMSESIAAISAALAKAQGDVENAGKNAANEAFKRKDGTFSRYADLAAVINAVRPVFSSHGLAIAQFPSFEDGIASVETIITHTSGEWMTGICSAPVTRADPQGVGSAITYLRRYSLAAVAGIAQEDDDGNEASAPDRAQTINVASILGQIQQATDVDELREQVRGWMKDCEVARDRMAAQAIKAAATDRANKLKGDA